MISKFEDRRDAGRQLAKVLKDYRRVAGLLVFGLPRGGVVVAYEVAEALNVPLEVFIVRKLGVPWQKELAMGALAEGGASVINQDVVAACGVTEEIISQVIEEEKNEIARRAKIYRGRSPLPVIRGREIILIDDGLATGATVLAAVKALKRKNPLGIILAVPVGGRETCQEVRQEVDEVICLLSPESFNAVGNWYEHFDQVTDEEVVDLLARSQSKRQPDGMLLENEGRKKGKIAYRRLQP